MKNDLKNQVEEIIIPEVVKYLPIGYLNFSGRLENVLQHLNVKLLGDLHKMSFIEIENVRNCGLKTLEEVREFAAKLKDENFVKLLDKEYQQHLENIQKTNTHDESAGKTNKTVREKILIPQSVKETPIICFTLSVRLKNVLDNLNISLLGDLEKFSIYEIEAAKNCGKKTLGELESLIKNIQKSADDEEFPEAVIALPTELDLNGLLRFINDFSDGLTDRERGVLLDRFGGNRNEKVWVLEKIGRKLNVTRERVRQIESQILKELKSHLTSISEAALEKISDDCAVAVCPLTARFLVHLTGNELSLFKYPPNFYVRLLSNLSPGIPTFFNKSKPTHRLNKKNKRIRQQIKNLLNGQNEFLTLVEVFNHISRQNAIDSLEMKDFVEAIQTNSFIIREGDSVDVFLIAADKTLLTKTEIARQVLLKSEFPLKYEEIIKRIGEMFGAEIETPSVYSLANLPPQESDFYLLDSRTIGLRQHFRLPKENWKNLQDNFYELLKNYNRPVSTTEVFNKNLFEWTKLITASEATEILREDKRFKDLGRFLFALAEWKIKKREPIKKLVNKVLEETDDALTAFQIRKRVQTYRSVSTTSIPAALHENTKIKKFGFDYYGLKSKDYREFFATNDRYIYRLVKKISPVTFGDLCEKLGLDIDEELADKTWQTLQKLGKLRLKPASRSAETIVIFKGYPLKIKTR